VTADADTFPAAQRSLITGTYFLIRNGTSYIMIGGGDLTWWPEYEIDLGGYVAEPPDDVEALRVAGSGGASGGLYARQYVAGWVLVNSSGGALTWTVPADMKQAAFSGGGPVAADGTQSAQTLTWTTDVPAGPLSVPSLSAVFLRDPAGAPPPGQEPGSDGGTDGGSGGGDGGTTPADGGAGGPDGGGVGDDGGGANGAGSGSPGSSGGCGCATVDASGGEGAAGVALLAIVSLFLARHRQGQKQGKQGKQGGRTRKKAGHTRPPGG
ncbi:MAG TPA: MYXO-CTERM sorting domain-containing protein, partial [Polyangiaceae bacterium]